MSLNLVWRLLDAISNSCKPQLANDYLPKTSTYLSISYFAKLETSKPFLHECIVLLFSRSFLAHIQLGIVCSHLTGSPCGLLPSPVVPWAGFYDTLFGAI